MKRTLKKLLPLLLSLGLLFGLQSTALASDAATALGSIGYIGDSSKCIMSSEMAEGYAAKLIGDENSDALAILLDPAGDGKPLMMTYAENEFFIWGWNGSRVYCYEAGNDAVSGHINDYFTGTYLKQGALYLADGVDDDELMPFGGLIYTVSNGNLRLAHRHTMYTAQILDSDPSIAIGDTLPLVNTLYYSGRYNSAYVSDLLNAGYVPSDNLLTLTKIDDHYLSFNNYDEIDEWNNSHADYCFKVGEPILSSKSWTNANDMRRALENYADIARPSENGATFADVPPTHYAYTPVQWAVGNGITVGTSATTFSPNQTCSTAHILTFLWRALGEPEPGIYVNPFHDVLPSDYYYKAALWAYQNDLVSGDYFYPDSPCTRSMAVYYFWLLHGSPVTSTNSFADVPTDVTYSQAVGWAVDRGITYGTSNSTFSPYETCTRAQIVSFLYRMMG